MVPQAAVACLSSEFKRHGKPGKQHEHRYTEEEPLIFRSGRAVRILRTLSVSARLVIVNIWKILHRLIFLALLIDAGLALVSLTGRLLQILLAVKWGLPVHLRLAAPQTVLIIAGLLLAAAVRLCSAPSSV